MHEYKTKNYLIEDTQNPVSKEIIKKCAYAYSKNKNFFKKDCKFFKITITNNEKELKDLVGKFYSPWVKGVGIKGKYIVIRGLESYKKAYKKYKGTPKFEMLLAHEMNHIFSAQLHLYRGPFWFTEGLAMYVAGQIPGKTYKFTKFKINVKDALFYKMRYNKLNQNMYPIQYWAVEYIIMIYGKGKLLKLINSYNRKIIRKSYDKIFHKIFGIKYTDFIAEFSKKMDKDTRL